MAYQDGHRQRVKERFRKEGLDHFDERYVLELLLFYCIPRQDTKELACRLLEHFGSIVQVLEASAEELEKVPGVGEGVSTFFSLRAAVEQYYQLKKAAQCDSIMNTADACGAFLRPYFMNKRNEYVYILCLDNKCKVLACKQLGEGSVNSANVSIRRIVEIALSSNATSVILAHNHPGGLAIPSNDDIQTTFRIAQALETVDLKLVDHFIFTDTDYVSLKVSGYFRKI